MIDPQVYREMGLIDGEYSQILDILGREPSITEIGMYAVMWSEHCGYKYSRPVLRLFKKYREAMDQGQVENAGVVDLGDGIGAVMKMESHNHPSAVEPFQGAATGVGGILRDIFTMGARPIAILDSLRFGTLDDARTRYLFEHVVEGIAHYGNCVGVPTVGGEITFHPCFAGNPLVNAMAVGIVPLGQVASAAAKGVGNPVIYVGSSTGRDGIHGATFASVELGPDSESKRPNVQMGDPFQEKLLIEATLEALATGRIVGIQDMGAAGLTCATSETASKAGNGMTIDVARVPRRESGMTPYEIMLSESQERMLAIAEKGHEDEVIAVFHKWGLAAEVIGEVTDTGRVVILDNGVVAADIPARSLTDDCPVYYLEAAEPAYIAELTGFDLSRVTGPADMGEALLKLLATPTIASKRWVYRQYDHMVQTQTVTFPGAADAAVLAIRGTKKAIALTSDCNPRYCYLDPNLGARHAVAEAARNLSCVGARPLAVTDCLNFPSPEKTEGFWQFERAVEGLAEACEAFGAPVISGNVSFYNETPAGAIYPTPTIGMIGLIEDAEKRAGMAFTADGDDVYLLLNGRATWGASEYLHAIEGVEAGSPPELNVEKELSVQRMVREGIRRGLIRSAHDAAEGGIAVAIAEKAITGGIGATLALPEEIGESEIGLTLFGERAATIVVTAAPQSRGAMTALAESEAVAMLRVGSTGGERLTLTHGAKTLIDLPVAILRDAYEMAIPSAIAHDPAG